MGTTASTLTRGAEQAWAQVIVFVPQFLAFLFIVALGYLVARLSGKIVEKMLHRIGFDHMVERSGIRKALAQSGYDVSDILGKLVFYTMFLFVLQLAFGGFGPNPISDLLTRTIAFLPNIFVAIVLTVIAASIASAVKEIVQASLSGLSYGKFLSNGAGMVILVVGVFAALNQLGIAPAIVGGLFYAVLAIVAGSAIIAIGGGGIVPMRTQWEKALRRIEEETPNLQKHLQGTSERAPVWVQEMQNDMEHNGRKQSLDAEGATAYTVRS